MTFLGVLFNTETMTMEITPNRLIEIRSLVKVWLNKKVATLKELQSLLGKLNFIGACVKPSRIFVARLLNWLRQLYGADKKIKHRIPDEVKKDLLWWNEFLPKYNGISLLYLGPWCEPDTILSCDACLEGCGGFWEGNYFHALFPSEILSFNLHIGALEMLALVLCLHLWASNFRHSRIVILCDNLSTCIAINSGKAKCPFLQKYIREICFISAVYEFEIKAQHISSSENRLADHLSRFEQGEFHRNEFFSLTKNYRLKEFSVKSTDFDILNPW
jgi:hypothetical protein